MRITHARRGAASGAPDQTFAVRRWLWAVIALVFVMILVGGATRLTGSGLSITEWRPVTGALPPLSEEQWLSEFEKYKTIPQYELINKGMSLDDFKFIYWWEWGHRQLGRLIGLLYLAGFVWFAARRVVPVRTSIILFAMGLLLGLQGAVGWIMVASGLKEGMVAVAPVKLTLHLMFASLFLASLVAMVTVLRPPVVPQRALPRRVRVGAAIVLGVLLLQIALGGLVAGSRAGLIYNTWPLMDGMVMPPLSQLFAQSPLIENFVDNRDLVQLNHRLVAYMFVALCVWHLISTARLAPDTAANKRARVIMLLACAQMALGIVTLLLAVPLWAGLLHQALAMVILAMAVVHVTRCMQARHEPDLQPVHS